MVILGIVGLTLDLVGVALLGVDLIRVQLRMRNDAADRITRLELILEDIGGIDSWAETVPNDFREGMMDEGRMIGLPGTFDADGARRSFEEALSVISEIGSHVITLANMQKATIDSDRETANLSLRYTHIGLGLIGCGFILQLASLIVP